ncbi:MAG: class I SAM-dependent methyltransferase [Chloroflexi bacterium]|nr:class I SAM-dependent methyltransferase [Chloroflexota bacterium]
MEATPLPSVDEAIRILRADPASGDLVRDAYLGRDVEDSATRFLASAEFVAVRTLLGDRLRGATVLDVGAGTGIASAAFLASGANRAIALEPDSSDEVGRGAIQRLGSRPGLEIVDGWGERIDLPDGTADIVYCRQALHHALDLPLMLRECARVLGPGGTFIACREHVVDDARQLEQFLAAHPIHRLAGGEHAFALGDYVSAIEAAGLTIQRQLGPWDSVINAFPMARTDQELAELPLTLAGQRLGRLGKLVASAPGGAWLARRWLERPRPGRLYSFLASKEPSI